MHTDNTANGMKEYSQKLLCCKVISKDQSKSERFVELEHYKLWSYMMFHKHGLKVRDLSLWLWVKEDEFEERKEVYSRSPEVVSVNKLELLLFDENNGFSHTINRYAKIEETKNLEKILFSHLSPELVTSGNYELTVHKCNCLLSANKNLEKMVLGLSDRDDRLWYREK